MLDIVTLLGGWPILAIFLFRRFECSEWPGTVAFVHTPATTETRHMVGETGASCVQGHVVPESLYENTTRYIRRSWLCCVNLSCRVLYEGRLDNKQWLSM